MGINIRQKGQEGEREVARALNSIVASVLEAHKIPVPSRPIFQRNQNQSAVGGSDLTNPFMLAVEVKRQEALSINTWWKQCCTAAVADGAIPVLIFRQNGNRNWRCILKVDVPLVDGTHVPGVRAEIDWASFLEWFYTYVDQKIKRGHWYPAPDE